MVGALSAVVLAECSIAVGSAAQHRRVAHARELAAEPFDVSAGGLRPLGVAAASGHNVKPVLCSSAHIGIATPKRDRRELSNDRVWVDEAGPKNRCEEPDVLGAAGEDLRDAQILGVQAQAYRPTSRPARMIRWRPSRFIGIRLAAASTAE